MCFRLLKCSTLLLENEHFGCRINFFKNSVYVIKRLIFYFSDTSPMLLSWAGAVYKPGEVRFLPGAVLNIGGKFNNWSVLSKRSGEVHKPVLSTKPGGSPDIL